MKKILLAIAVFGMIISMSCENEPGNEEKETPNPFVGTWEQEGILRYIFTKTTVKQFEIDDMDETMQFSGTYAYNDTHITITTDYRIPLYEDAELYPNPFVWTYRFEDDTLIIGLGSFKKVSGLN